MHRLLAPACFALLLLGFTSTAAPPAAAAGLGTSTWSLELASDLGTGDESASFAVRRHSGATSAFRFRIEIDVDKQDGDGVRTDTGNPDTDVAQSQEFSGHALSIQWMRFAALRDNVSATFALGPIVRKQRFSGLQDTDIGLPTYFGIEQSERATTYGLDLGLGMEWFLNPRISLGGQTGLRATTGTAKRITIIRSGNGATYDKQELDIESDVMEVTTATARFQLTAYF